MSANTDLVLRMGAEIEQFVIAGAGYFAEQIAELNAVGGEGAPPAPKDTGNLRGSVRMTVGTPSTEEGVKNPKRSGSYPLVTAQEFRRAIQLGGFRMGDTLYFRWIAPYANIIEGGRRPDKNGRIIGSEEAPDGWVGPGLVVARARLAAWRWVQ